MGRTVPRHNFFVASLRETVKARKGATTKQAGRKDEGGLVEQDDSYEAQQSTCFMDEA